MKQMITNILKNLGRGPSTRRYPYVRREPITGSRGRLVINPEICSYCGICAKKCPSDALAVNRAPKSWTLDPYKCILCGYCVEACPKKCLSMDPRHTAANE